MDKTLTKIKKIEGQISGIRKMYEEERGCLDIVQQIVAVRSALASVAKDVLTNEATRCARSESKEDDFERILKTLVSL